MQIYRTVQYFLTASKLAQILKINQLNAGKFSRRLAHER